MITIVTHNSEKKNGDPLQPAPARSGPLQLDRSERTRDARPPFFSLSLL